MHLRYDPSTKKIVLVLIVAIVTFSGCGRSLFTYKRDKVTQEDRLIQLDAGNHQGVWNAKELAIHYEYQMTPDALKISGAVELVGGFAIGFKRIGRLAVHILFLDNQGIVIEDALVCSMGNRQTNNFIPILFERTIPIPEGARTFSFAYDGVLDQNYDIWFSPSKQ